MLYVYKRYLFDFFQIGEISVPILSKTNMQYEIIKNPMGLIEFTINKYEKITAEVTTIGYIRGNIVTETKMRKGGFLKSLKAAALGGESFFVDSCRIVC